MTVSLDLTTNWAALEWCIAMFWKHWGQPLTLDQFQKCMAKEFKDPYFGFDRDLSREKEGGYWYVLNDDSVENETSDPELKHIVACCSLVVRKAWSSKEKTVHDSYTCTVGFVFTDERYRRRGYAKKMMHLVVKKAQDLLPDQLDSSFLYSDVGTFYEQFGFQSYPTPVALLPPRETPLDIEYKPIARHYEKYVAAYGKRLKALVEKSNLATSVVPTQTILKRWETKAKPCGVAIGAVTAEGAEELVFGAELDTGDFIIWNQAWPAKIVYVLLILADSVEGAKNLLEICRAHSPKGFQVEVWQDDVLDYSKQGAPDAELKKYLAATGTVDNPNHTLNSLQMLHLRDRAEWVANGKWCWF